MKKLVATIAGKIPRELKNYHLIKRQNIYIPYREIGVVCLTKEVTEINLFFETILKLVDINVNDVHEIATIMGVEFKLLKEAIVDMIEQQYLITSENKLIMTPRGKKALMDRRLVTIRKKNINQIAVNMITGNIDDNEKKWLDDIPKNSNCLNEEQTISKDFLESRYADINEIYQKNQIETSIFNTTYLQRELYKILGIAYEKLYYVKEEILIYKNNESTDFEFVISGDVGEKYLNSFYRQVRDVVYPGMENFFERDRKFAETHYNASIVTLEEKEIKQKLLKDLSESEVVLDEHVEKYEQTREIIDNTEIDTMIHYNTEIDYQALIVSCNRMRKLLNTSIAASINQISKKKIWLLYNNEEYEINNFLDSLFAIKKKKGEIFFLERQDSETEFICFYPNILIEFVEKTENVFGRPLTVVEGRVKFDSIVIKEKIDKIISDKNPFFSINKPEKSDRTCIENGVVLTYGYRNTKQKRYTNKTKGRKH